MIHGVVAEFARTQFVVRFLADFLRIQLRTARLFKGQEQSGLAGVVGRNQQPTLRFADLPFAAPRRLFQSRQRAERSFDPATIQTENAKCEVVGTSVTRSRAAAPMCARVAAISVSLLTSIGRHVVFDLRCSKSSTTPNHDHGQPKATASATRRSVQWAGRVRCGLSDAVSLRSARDTAGLANSRSVHARWHFSGARDRNGGRVPSDSAAW